MSGQVSDPTPNPLATLITATIVITLGALPIFLVGANAIFIREEMGFGETALGAAASLYYVGAAGMSLPGGKITERLGYGRAMALAAFLTLISVLGIALVARLWWILTLFLVIGGTANGIAFPSSALALSKGIPIRRQGVAFGIKQSSGPYATLLAGASVPLLGLTVGWRWAFVTAALLTFPVMWRWRDGDTSVRRKLGSKEDVDGRSLWILSAGAFAVVIATSSFGAFYVESAVFNGIEPALAGTLLAVGSGLGVVSRIMWGFVADRKPSWHFPIITSFLVVGSAAFGFMGSVQNGPMLLALTVLVFGSGWAWPSVLAFAVVQRQPKAPAVASGIIGTGQYGGGIIGPLGFGFLVERYSYEIAWQYAAAMALIAAALMFFGGRRLGVGHIQAK